MQKEIFGRVRWKNEVCRLFRAWGRALPSYLTGRRKQSAAYAEKRRMKTISDVEAGTARLVRIIDENVTYDCPERGKSLRREENSDEAK